MLMLTALYLCIFPPELSAQLKISISPSTAQPGDKLSIPVELSGISADSSIFSIQFDLTYDPGLITADSVIFNNSSPIISEWKKEYNLTDSRISVALAGADFVPTDVELANLTFFVSEFAANGDSSVLRFENLYVNEGTPTASGQDGIVKVVVVGIIERANSSIPISASLGQNYPNPFNPLTKIEFSVPHSGDVSLIIYNVNGGEVARLIDSELAIGNFSAVWNAPNMASGIYFYRLRTGEFTQTKKMLLLK